MLNNVGLYLRVSTCNHILFIFITSKASFELESLTMIHFGAKVLDIFEDN